jgi:hypothetical protein
VIYLVRDTRRGYDDMVMVWDECPKRLPDSEGITWYIPGGKEPVTWHSVKTAKLIYPTLPDDDRMIVRYEGEARRVPAPK